jgi:poly(3-hydroxybutyrate) depolymerase
VAGERVDPSKITDSALLTIEGELDDISGSGQTRAAHKLCTGIPQADQQHYTVPGAGHYGIFSGRRWRTQVYPQVREFIAAHTRKPEAAVSAAKQAMPASKPAVKKPAAKKAVATKKKAAAKTSVAAKKVVAKKTAAARKVVAKKNAR